MLALQLVRMARVLWIRVVLAVGLVALTTLLKLTIPGLGRELPFLLFFVGILGASVLDGWQCGLLAVVLSTLSANVLFLPPYGELSLLGQPAWQSATFLFGGSCFVFLTRKLQLYRSSLIAAQRDAEQRARRIYRVFEHAPAHIIVFRGPEHVIELVNEAARKLLGGRELVGRALWTVLPEMAPEDRARLDSVYRSGQPLTLSEVPIQLDWDGSGKPYARHLDLTYAPYSEGGPDVLGVVAISVDVSAKVDLLRREREARAAAEEATRAKDAFLATISHELRTPLNAILGWSRLLRTSLPPEKQARALETIERNALVQVQLIEDLLDLTRITTGKLRLEVAPVELSSIVEAAVDAVRPSADAKQIELATTINARGAKVAGDGNRLQQVVWNLLSNAVKFTAPGGHVEAKVQSAAGRLEVSVRDDGQGIAPAFIPYVFESFRQADTKTSRRSGGLGLGLAISKHIVELHGGTIAVDSPGEGQGTTFKVELPLASQRPPSSSRDALLDPPRDSGAFARPPELAGLRVLLVDDEPDARELAAVILSSCGSITATAADVSEALSLVDTFQPDVLVSDLGMPGDDGYGFIEKLRAREPARGGTIPAAALTAYTHPEDRRRALAAGFQMHVAKPVEPAELVAVVASLSRMRGLLRG